MKFGRLISAPKVLSVMVLLASGCFGENEQSRKATKIKTSSNYTAGQSCSDLRGMLAGPSSLGLAGSVLSQAQQSIASLLAEGGTTPHRLEWHSVLSADGQVLVVNIGEQSLDTYTRDAQGKYGRIEQRHFRDIWPNAPGLVRFAFLRRSLQDDTKIDVVADFAGSGASLTWSVPFRGLWQMWVKHTSAFAQQQCRGNDGLAVPSIGGGPETCGDQGDKDNGAGAPGNGQEGSKTGMGSGVGGGNKWLSHIQSDEGAKPGQEKSSTPTPSVEALVNVEPTTTPTVLSLSGAESSSTAYIVPGSLALAGPDFLLTTPTVRELIEHGDPEACAGLTVPKGTKLTPDARVALITTTTKTSTSLQRQAGGIGGFLMGQRSFILHANIGQDTRQYLTAAMDLQSELNFSLSYVDGDKVYMQNPQHAGSGLVDPAFSAVAISYDRGRFALLVTRIPGKYLSPSEHGGFSITDVFAAERELSNALMIWQANDQTMELDLLAEVPVNFGVGFVPTMSTSARAKDVNTYNVSTMTRPLRIDPMFTYQVNPFDLDNPLRQLRKQPDLRTGIAPFMVPTHYDVSTALPKMYLGAGFEMLDPTTHGIADQIPRVRTPILAAHVLKGIGSDGPQYDVVEKLTAGGRGSTTTANAYTIGGVELATGKLDGSVVIYTAVATMKENKPYDRAFYEPREPDPATTGIYAMRVTQDGQVSDPVHIGHSQSWPALLRQTAPTNYTFNLVTGLASYSRVPGAYAFGFDDSNVADQTLFVMSDCGISIHDVNEDTGVATPAPRQLIPASGVAFDRKCVK